MASFPIQFWIVIVSTFLGFVGVGAIVPLLGPHVKLDLRQSDVMVGVVLGIFSIVALTSRLIAGPVTDSHGRRAGLISGLACCSLAGLLYLLPFGISGILAARVLQGLGEAFLFVSAAAWAVELAPKDRRAQALGYLGAGVWGGMAAGPAIGSILVSFSNAALLLALSPLPAIWALRRVPDTLERSGRKPSFHIPRAALLPGIALGLVNVHYPAMSGFLMLHLAKRGPTVGAKAFSAYAIVILTSRFFLGGLPDRVGPRVTLYTGLATMACGLGILSSAPAPWLAVAAAALTGLGFSLPWPSIASTVLNRASEDERASSVGVLTACVDLFVGFASLGDGSIAQHFGYTPIYWVATFSVVVAATVGWIVTPVRSTTHDLELQPEFVEIAVGECPD
ncbi:MAG TPA: MFS transporter [Bryobacteraceae bacterium]|jgi:MFS family permease